MAVWSFASLLPPRNGPLLQRVLIASSHSTAGAVPSCGGFACIACGFKRAAERKIMRSDITQVACRRQCLKDKIRSDMANQRAGGAGHQTAQRGRDAAAPRVAEQGRDTGRAGHAEDRKSTRLNSSHMSTSYAVFCLKKKKRK